METSFLDYYKLILAKVSFDHKLFNKEYKKALKSLKDHEVEKFHQWLESTGYIKNLQIKTSLS
ncbi:hypothetical protein BKI52_09100 [marine bacterium AO1-C]|nr:hypothetical protein BKI52_09100 [marine bacterium AO1-C]